MDNSGTHTLAERLMADAEKLTGEELMSLALHSDIKVRVKVARRRDCPPDVAEQLFNDTDWQVLQALAGNPNCPDFLLSELAQNPDWAVRCEVAINDHCPSGDFSILAEDDDYAVLEQVASNPKCPKHLFLQLSIVDDLNVQLACYRNPNCPLSIVLTGCRDIDGDVQEACFDNLRSKNSDFWMQELANGLRLDKPEIGGNPNISFGDKLLALSLTDVYQQVQAAELQNAVNSQLRDVKNTDIKAKSVMKL